MSYITHDRGRPAEVLTGVTEVVTDSNKSILGPLDLGGTRRTFAGLELKEWAFLCTALISILVVIILTTMRLVTVIIETPHSPDFAFTIVILFNAIFCAYYIIHGILKECDFEIYAYIAASVTIMTYIIVEYVINSSGRTLVKEIRLIIGCILVPLNIILGLVVAKEFGWLEFRIVGASQRLQYAYREATRYACMLKFDVEVALSLVILALRDGTELKQVELIILVVGIPYSIIWLVLGIFVMRQENKPLVWMFAFLGLLEPIFVGYKVYITYEFLFGDKNDSEHKTINADEYALIYTELAAGALALVVRGMVYIELVRIVKNFGKGLKERAFSSEISEQTSLLHSNRR